MRRRDEQPPVVPLRSVGGYVLSFVAGAICFLTALASIAAIAVDEATHAWTEGISKEVTVQIYPEPPSDVKQRLAKALRIIRAFPGILSARPYTDEEMKVLLEPWLGSAFEIGALPLPTLIAIEKDMDVPIDLTALARALKEHVPGSSLEDHHIWKERFQSFTNWTRYFVFTGIILLFGVTISVIVFATHGAMESNRDVIELLHRVGANDLFIIWQFGRHFLYLSVKGAVLGGGAAILIFSLVQAFAPPFSLLFGEADSSAGWSRHVWAHICTMGVVLLLSAVSLVSSCWTASRRLKSMY